MKKNELVPVGNGESFTRCGWIRLALKTLFEDPHASFFVETIPLCVQLNLIVLLRLAMGRLQLRHSCGCLWCRGLSFSPLCYRLG